MLFPEGLPLLRVQKATIIIIVIIIIIIIIIAEI